MQKIKIGIIGIGAMGSVHAAGIAKLDNAELTALCDIDKEKVDELSDKLGVKAFYRSSELLEHGNIDAVIIATPHFSHPDITLEAFSYNKHVLVEKPIAVHKGDALKMLEGHKKNQDLIFAVMFNQRTFPAHKKIKSIIKNNELGEIRRVNWIITSWYRTQAYYNSGGWRATWQGEGGGVLINQCPHQLDLFQWFFGLPQKVWAKCSLGRYHDIEVEDEVTAVCEFKNGSTGVFITTTGEAPGTNRLEIIGDNGKLIFENEKIQFTRLEVPTSKHLVESEHVANIADVWNIEIPYKSQANNLTDHQKIISNFVEVIRDPNKQLIAPAHAGLKGLELGNAMLISGLRGREVKLPLKNGEYESLLKELIAQGDDKE
jgi:predicted dehydrogenase